MNSCDQESIGRLLYLTTQTMTFHSERALKPFSLTVEQMILLKNIAENDGLSQNQLCVIVEKSAANVTRILDRLEKKAFLRRERNPADRRSILLFLTDQGKKLVKEVAVLFESFSEQLVIDISSQEQVLFSQLLHKIQNNLTTLTDTSFT